MHAAVDNAESKARRKFVLIVLAEAAALAIAVVAMLQFDLGWIGVIVIALLIAAFTIAIVRLGEGRARAGGNFSPAMGRYNRRMLAAGAIYMAGLFTAIWAHDALRPDGVIAFAIAFLPSVGVLWMVWAMGRLLAEEEDEYQRHKLIRSSLFGLGTLLTLATIWGFFEQFDLVPHVPTWAAVPVFALGLGIAGCFRGADR